MKFLTLILLLFSLGVSAQTSVDHEKENGGGECDKRITYIKEDINNWLNADGHMGLELPEGLSHGDYKEGMLLAIADTVIECTTETIEVNGAEKTCVNMPGKMTCNIESFMEHTSEDGQYGLIHHEYAGLAGFETNDGGAESDYTISDQITGFLETVEVRKLAVTKPDGEFVDLCYAAGIGMYLAIKTGADSCAAISKQKLLGINSLRVIGFNIPTIKKHAFKFLPNLETLEIEGTKTHEIEGGAFLGLNNLTTLVIERTEIQALNRYVFEGLDGLVHLVVSSNSKLTELKPGLFDPMVSLDGVKLSGNKISEIPPKFFRNQSKLVLLRLHYNNLKTLPEDLFVGLESLEKLDLYENPWECVSGKIQRRASIYFYYMDWYWRDSKKPPLCD